MLIALNAATEMGQFLGDTICSLKVAWLFAQNHKPDKIILALSPKGQLNFLWKKFIDIHNAEVVVDAFDPGNMSQRFAAWDHWRRERAIEGRPFDIYRELYRRIDGGDRQGRICGGEVGLGKKNIFEYVYFGQEGEKGPCVGGDSFGDDLIYWKPAPRDRDVLIAPYAKCQGNRTFTFEFWEQVIRRLVGEGLKVSVAHQNPFCDDLNGAHYRRFFGSFEMLQEECCRHRLVACGNTGVGWLAAACGVPLLAMQPPDSHMQDYRYEWCGVRSLVEFVEQPDVEYVAGRVREECERRAVFTNGCFDVLHAGHVRHLERSRSLGTRLVVGLNSDDSVRRLKGPDRPINARAERSYVLEALRDVDEVRVFEEDTPIHLIRSLRPDVLTKGPDYAGKEIVGREFVEALGGKVVVIDKDFDTSTTKIVQRTKGIVSKMPKPYDALQLAARVQHLTPNPPAKMRLLAEQYFSVMHLDGCVADVGSYKGASAYILRHLNAEKELHLFDNWGAGNPHRDPLCHHGPGEWNAGLHECQELVGLDMLTAYHQGVFPETTVGLEEKRFCFVFVDVDTYQTTAAAIEWFWPRMVKGGKMVFDDIDHLPCAGVEKAINEAFKADQLARFVEHMVAVTK